ncbi:MAG TPA: hypothetical protein VGM54_24405 [Chthoniobacter sp.]|jgi:hypothetical protein
MKSPLLSLVFAGIGLMPLHATLDQSLRALAAVGREGQGNEMASSAWKDVVASGPSSLPELLAAAGKGSPVADNWLRVAGETIVSNARQQSRTLPVAEIEAFLKDTGHAPAARRLAFDLLQQADPARAEAIVPSLARDPVQELRRGAVQRLIDAAQSKEGEPAKAAYLEALDAVRDEDQTRTIVKALRELGVPVDLPKHFGFLRNWQIIGPFENTGREGFATVFPPEKEVRLDATYPGKSGPVKWQPVESQDEYGKFDFNKPLGMLKEVTAYAVTTFDSPEERDAELRLGCKDAWKIWLNGQFLFGRDEYHRGQKMDQYKLKCHLRKGPNVILVKCCQNEQTEQWTVEWEFQLRICDGAGTAILAANTTKP